MKARRRHALRSRAAALAAGTILAPLPARAAPWIPLAGTGEIKPMVRYFRADTAFPAKGGFTTNAVPGPSASETQFRVTGDHGLGGGFALEYDLRYGWAEKNRAKGKRLIFGAAHGPRDQEIGLAYGLTQTPAFADSVVFHVEFPTGSAGTTPALGTGRWAVEPDFEIGTRFAHNRLELTGKFGARAFLDGLTTQLRATVQAGFKPTSRIKLWTEAFYVRSIVQRDRIPPAADGELYNVLRLGGGIGFRLTPRLAPYLLYERYVAGKAIHAGQRLTIGLAIQY
ncbi:MAG: transporter [Rhodospirillales bacterium]|nr:transporter [Rhodospirillales bacterium]